MRESRPALLWVSAAFVAGVLLNIDRGPMWPSAVALVCVVWRLGASLSLSASATARIALPGTLPRSLLALILVAAVLGRYHTLNGLSAGTALLALMGGVKLLETRAQRDHYIMIGAALFLLVAACLDRQSLPRIPLYLLDAWLCCSALAAAAHDSAAPGPAPALLAGKALLIALPLAVALFLLFPRLPGAFWAIPRTDVAATGLGDTLNPGAIAQLTQSYDIAFRARFEGAPPPPEERYWRGPVLHEFDGVTWRMSTHNYLPRQSVELLGPAYRYQVSLEPSDQRWWFALDTAAAAPATGVFLTFDRQLIASRPVTEATRYSAVSYTHSRSEAQISAPERQLDTQLPTGRNPRSRSLAERLRARNVSEERFVAAVLDYLRSGGFRYSLTPPLLGAEAVDDFLFNTRLGFCGHYASAFVDLMRAGGVPARVVSGYLGGEWNPIGHYFIVRQSDAHAWAEVWLPGRGWVRVDPTAVVEPERLRRGILDLLPDAVSAPARLVWSTPWLASLLQRWDAANTWWNERVLRFNYDAQLRLLTHLGWSAPGLGALASVFGTSLLAWLGIMGWRLSRLPHAARPDRLTRIYSRLCRKLRRAGLARAPHEGPLAFAASIERRRPELAPAVQPLFEQYARLRFGTRLTERARGVALRALARAVARLRLEPARAVRGRSRTGA